MIILGVDLGSKATGLALVVDGVPIALDSFPGMVDGSGLRPGIKAFLAGLTDLEKAAGKIYWPDFIATEIPFFCPGKARGGPVIAHLAGVLCEVARSLGIPFRQVGISTWKQALGVKGNATPRQYWEAVCARFDFPPGKEPDENEAAAIGIALAAEGDGKEVYDD